MIPALKLEDDVVSYVGIYGVWGEDFVGSDLVSVREIHDSSIESLQYKWLPAHRLM
jgi:hypothetical protein